MKKRLFSLFMSLIMVISLVSVLPTMTAGAANDSIQNAESYTFGSNKNSNITQSIDCRVYKFILPSSGKIKISYTGYLEYSDVYIYDSNGEEQYKSTYMRWNDNTKKINLTDYIDLTKGTYYFSVSKRYGCTGNYNFSITQLYKNVSGFKVASTSSSSVKIT